MNEFIKEEIERIIAELDNHVSNIIRADINLINKEDIHAVTKMTTAKLHLKEILTW